MKKILSIFLAIAMLPCIAMAAGTASGSTGYDISISGTTDDHTVSITVSGKTMANDYALVTVLDHLNDTKHGEFATAIENSVAFDAPYKIVLGADAGLALDELNIATYKKHFDHAQADANGDYSITFGFDPDATIDKVYLLIGAGGSFDATYEATALYVPSEATITAAEGAMNDGTITAADLNAYDYVFGLNTASAAYARVPEKLAAGVTQLGATSADVKTHYNTVLAFYTKQLEALDMINSVSTTPDVLYDILTNTHGDVIGDFGSTLTSAQIAAKYQSYNYITVNSLLVGTTYSSMEAFKSAFLAATPTVITPGDNQGTPSNPTDQGGGGGGGGGAPTVPLMPTEPAGEKELFSDLDSVPWAKESINNLAKREVINGMGDGTFNPNGNVTREQFVKMLMLAFNADIKNVKTKFNDVDPTQWYGVYINTACEYGIVNGVSEVKFGVGASITRQDLVTMLLRACTYFGVTLPSGTSVAFADAGQIADYAFEAVNAMAGAGIVNGVSAGEFAPNQFATRAQVAVILDRLSNLY